MTADRVPTTYWDHDPAAPVDCPRCDWTGVSEGENEETFLDVRCPACDGPILKLAWPTPEETRRAAAAGNLRARAEIPHADALEERWERAARLALDDPARLPRIDAEHVAVVWDQVEEDGEQWTVLRHGERELVRELAYWEGIDRFVEVVGILRAAYGRRLRSVVPTPRSETYLFGDRLGAPRQLEALNEELAAGG